MKSLIQPNIATALFITIALAAATKAAQAAETEQALIQTDGPINSVEPISPLPSDRLAEFGRLNNEHEAQARYGLLDRDSEQSYNHLYNSQQNALIMETAQFQLNSQLKTAKQNIKDTAGNTPEGKAAIFAATAYMVYNGQALKTHLTDSTEVKAQAKGTERRESVGISQTHLPLLNLSSAVQYQHDPESASSVTTSLSKELLPHWTASVDQKRRIANETAAPTENTGRLNFGVSF